MSIKIEEGKYYRTRDGQKVGPMKPSGRIDWPWIVVRGDGQCWNDDGSGVAGTDSPDLMSEWSDDTQKRWRDMTDEEKGALLLAHHEGKVIEMGSHIIGASRLAWSECPSTWKPTCTGIYRIKPEPKRETVEMRSEGSPTNRWCFCTDINLPYDTHRITFDTIDGEPDCASIKMEKL